MAWPKTGWGQAALGAAVLGAVGLAVGSLPLQAPPQAPDRSTRPAPAGPQASTPKMAPAAAPAAPAPPAPIANKAQGGGPDPSGEAALGSALQAGSGATPPPLSEQQEHSLDVLLAFVFDEGLPDSTARSIEALYRGTWSKAAAVRAAVASGDLDEEQAREADAALRAHAGTRLSELLNSEQRGRLRAAMRDADAGGL